MEIKLLSLLIISILGTLYQFENGQVDSQIQLSTDDNYSSYYKVEEGSMDIQVFLRFQIDETVNQQKFNNIVNAGINAANQIQKKYLTVITLEGKNTKITDLSYFLKVCYQQQFVGAVQIQVQDSNLRNEALVDARIKEGAFSDTVFNLQNNQIRDFTCIQNILDSSNIKSDIAIDLSNNKMLNDHDVYSHRIEFSTGKFILTNCGLTNLDFLKIFKHASASYHIIIGIEDNKQIEAKNAPVSDFFEVNPSVRGLKYVAMSGIPWIYLQVKGTSISEDAKPTLVEAMKQINPKIINIEYMENDE